MSKIIKSRKILMKKIKKFMKITFLASLALFFLGICSGVIFYHTITYGISLDNQKLNETKTANSLVILDGVGNTLTKPSESFISITKLSSDTKNAFICAEDKRFYFHGGIDIIRMGKALISNIKTRSFSQGASTISQQLIKNTQLSSEKTLTRKLKEIKLTSILEKEYSKDEILEMYLNNIYFGNGCYGIESAAKHYFSKSASELSLSESAALAATINAPSYYDLEDKPENVKTRRNLILDLMQNNGKINEIECKKAKNEEILLNLQNLSSNTFLFDEIINEACSALNTTPNNLVNKKIKIYTNLNLDLISKSKSAIKNNYSNLESNPDIATIVIDNKTNNIISITGNKNIFSSKKQPGSAIKPILVYAPAIENNNISPATKILDEPINISGYSPTNSNGKFHGYVSVRESIKNSYNVPAVKILNELGISNAQNFAKKLGIEFSNADNNLAIALGGFTEGITLKSLADAYTAFANGGNFSTSSYISKITQNDKIIYTNSVKKNQVMKDSTAYLITDMLKDASKTGTAKRLKDFSFEIASKTGTVGSSSSTKNKEAFNISYTSKHTILTYFGGTIMPEIINGSTYPTMLAKDILTELYKNNNPLNFTIPTSVKQINLNKKDYQNNIITTETQIENIITENFAVDNIPKNNTLSFDMNIYNFANKKPIIEFETSKEFSYEIIRKQKEKEEILSSSYSNNLIKFEDQTASSDEIYEYFIRFKNLESSEINESNHITLKSF